MDLETVAKEIYELDSIIVTRVYRGSMIEDGILINIISLDEHKNSLTVYGNNDAEIKLEGEITYDEELGYVFTNGELVTYIAA